MKTIEDQEEKQIDALKLLGPKEPEQQLVNVNDYEDKSLHSKERKVFRKIYNRSKKGGFW